MESINDTKFIRWSFGSCNSSRQPNSDQEYENNKEYDQTCCFYTSPNHWVYELICEHWMGNGWGNGFIIIQGRRYCDNFKTGFVEYNFVEETPSKFFVYIYQRMGTKTIPKKFSISLDISTFLYFQHLEDGVKRKSFLVKDFVVIH